MHRPSLLVLLLALATPVADAAAVEAAAGAPQETVLSLMSNGRTLRVPVDPGYVRGTLEAPEIFALYGELMNAGKGRLLDLLITREDIARLDEGQDGRSMLFKLGIDPLFGTAIVRPAQWASAKPGYEAAIGKVDVRQVSERMRERTGAMIDRIIAREDASDAGVEFRMGELSPPRIYRSDAQSFRLHATVPTTLSIGDSADKTLYLGFAAVVNLDGRVFLLGAERVAPKDAAGFDAARATFDGFIDRVIALNRVALDGAAPGGPATSTGGVAPR